MTRDRPSCALSARTQQIYDRNAARFNSERARNLSERPWLERFRSALPRPGDILDLGCGPGEPIAGWLIAAGHDLTGVDASPAMIALARRQQPAGRWVRADMRRLSLGRQFAGIIGWHSFFHLTPAEQRATLPILSRHLRPGGVLMLTVGPEAGEVTGRVGDDRVYHASLSRAEYRAGLTSAGLTLTRFAANDAACDFATVLMARKAGG